MAEAVTVVAPLFVVAEGSVPALEADESGATEVGTTAFDAAETTDGPALSAVTVKV